MLRLPFISRRRRRSSLSRYLGAGEQVVLSTRQHPFALVRAATRTLGLLVPLLVAAWGLAGIEMLDNIAGTWLLRGLFVVMFVMLLNLAWDVLEWEFERVVVTGEKVIHLEGVLSRRIASTPLAKVSEFSVRQPLLGRVFDYGSLVVDVPGGRDQALHGLAFLPDPASLYRTVSDLARRGRVKEGGGTLDEERVVAPAPTGDDLARIEHTQQLPIPGASTHRPDPWQPTLDADEADHTISIPRIPPM